jgi:hypothetical protein
LKVAAAALVEPDDVVLSGTSTALGQIKRVRAGLR